MSGGIIGTQPRGIVDDSVGAACERVVGHLGSLRLGTSVEVLSRVLKMTPYDVEACLDILMEQGRVRVVRRTKTRITYGVTK